ncbi:hypothetical protein ZD91_17265 [Salmonella enterica subsp. enterica]|nr:hypothetical protein [Salmonella enterica subsp. enterica serovar Bovismorbificans]
MCRSPQSPDYLCSWELTPLSPLSNSNYFEYSGLIILSRWLYSSDINDIVVIVNTFFIIKSY